MRRRSARTNQAVQEHEQLANTVRRGIARDEPGVREQETEQRAAAREVPGVREQETEQRGDSTVGNSSSVDERGRDDAR